MKRIKIYFLLILLLVTSCNSDDDSPELVSFNPPEWLIGTWNNESSEAFLQTYVISENNVMLIYPDGDQLDYTEYINSYSSKNLIENEITDTRYSYTITDNLIDPFEEDYTVEFEKISDNEIELFVSTGVVIQTYFRE